MTSLVRIMEETEGRTRDLFTRDFLGGGAAAAAASAKENSAETDLQVHSGWERHLDLMSGRTYLNKMDSDRSIHGMHDLNLPPPSSSGFQLPDDSSLLDLKLARGHGDGNRGYCGSFQSVCTLEKVKSALERAGRARASEQIRQSEVVSSASASASPSSSTTSSSMKRRVMGEEDDGGSAPAGGMMVAACPSCLLYVLISKANPRCPRCESHVPLAFIPKKLKLDLNSC